MKLEIKNIINKHKGIPAMVIGHGPSYDEYMGRMQSYKDKGFILLDCNEWYGFGNPPVVPAYWVLSNTQLTIPFEISRINQFLPTILYADVVDLTDRNWVDQNVKCDYLPYDNRHFDSRTQIAYCGSGCCKHLIPNRLTLQEELMKYANHDKRYNSGHTVVEFSLTFAVLMGCNPIYVTGIDCSYKYGYAKTDNDSIKQGDPLYFEPRFNDIMDDFKVINDSAKNVGTKIINLNMNSSFDVFELGSI